MIRVRIALLFAAVFGLVIAIREILAGGAEAGAYGAGRIAGIVFGLLLFVAALYYAIRK